MNQIIENAMPHLSRLVYVDCVRAAQDLVPWHDDARLTLRTMPVFWEFLNEGSSLSTWVAVENYK